MGEEADRRWAETDDVVAAERAEREARHGEPPRAPAVLNFPTFIDGPFDGLPVPGWRRARVRAEADDGEAGWYVEGGFGVPRSDRTVRFWYWHGLAWEQAWAVVWERLIDHAMPTRLVRGERRLLLSPPESLEQRHQRHRDAVFAVLQRRGVLLVTDELLDEVLAAAHTGI